VNITYCGLYIGAFDGNWVRFDFLGPPQVHGGGKLGSFRIVVEKGSSGEGE
jgi:hypothetical protein